MTQKNLGAKGNPSVLRVIADIDELNRSYLQVIRCAALASLCRIGT